MLEHIKKQQTKWFSYVARLLPNSTSLRALLNGSDKMVSKLKVFHANYEPQKYQRQEEHHLPEPLSKLCIHRDTKRIEKEERKKNRLKLLLNCTHNYWELTQLL
uniref:Uncharacterized protein n=2 Tax=Arion vulgaris TaxID=1028688 RepID=A0A0B7BJD2_9EUPU